MKKIVLIGATGFVGSAILKEALQRGYRVKAVARHLEKITVENPNLEKISADVSSVETVKELCKGADAVISAYNPGWTNPDIYEDTLRVYPAILKGVKEAGVKRILIVGGAGSLYVSPGVRVMDTGVLPEEIIPGVKGLAEFYTDILKKEEDLDWVFFSPAGQFVDGGRTGSYRLGGDDLITDADGDSKISVEDYAKAMIDELESPQHHKERFTIGY
ncbi:MAG: NAD(P)-dependent oxidoreductase [Rikenellaceae bacterium]|nr:NAD(P)-dependent oxidoreductase [Rikenellaceae bacterium]